MKNFFRESVDKSRMSPKLIMDLFVHNTMKTDRLLKEGKIKKKDLEALVELGTSITNVMEGKGFTNQSVNVPQEVLDSMKDYNQKSQGIYDKLEQKKAI